MNHTQRNQHFWMWVILGPLAIAVLIGALLYRQAPALDHDRDNPAQSAPAPAGGQP